MKLNLVALVTILGCTPNAVLASTCSESSGVCVCSGDCPSFTDDWTSSINSESTCVATKTGSTTSIEDGVVTVNNQTYTIIDPCSVGSSAGIFDAHLATVVVAAVVVAGGVAAL
mmetsp:Transcript_29354/g.43137  ORF Transcript_29354/g.43137 Transcript_29354/m.43137 type:complete len:114 (-) Transcript_29354:210-551(-)